MTLHMHNTDLFSDISNNTDAKRWFACGVVALAIAGLFSLILVVARTPGLSDMPYFADLFHVSLVIHVDLSVLVWFLAISGMAMHLQLKQGAERTLPYFNSASGYLLALAIAAMTLSPLWPEWHTIKSNYIPVLSNPVFFLGLGLLAASMTVLAVQWLAGITLLTPPVETIHGVLRRGINASALILVVALAVFAASGWLIDPALRGESFYEHLFWGGGHVLQLLYVQVMLVAWIAMAHGAYGKLPAKPAMLGWLLLITPLVALLSPLAFAHEITSYEFRQLFTWQMNGGAGIAGSLLALLLLPYLFKRAQKGQRALVASLWMSIVLFAVGGMFGAHIVEQNVLIPAHYHGSIVAVTIALMGFAYLLLPQFGYAPVAQTRTAFIQPLLYGFGQLMHISGLAWSGGYGVMRKSPGEFGEGVTQVKIAMGIMGMGGMLAIIGGLLFVWVVVKSVWFSPAR